MDKPMIFGKIADVQQRIAAIQKGNQNKQQGWNFRSIDDIYNELHELLAEYRIFSVPVEIINLETSERTTERGTVARLSTVIVRYRFYAEDGSFVESCVPGEAVDFADKSIGKCMSYSHKCFFIQIFTIPTKEEKDPDFNSIPLLPQQQQPPKLTGLSEAQVKRAFAIALSKGITADMLKAQCLKVCGSNEIKNLSKQQYDTLCSAIEARPTYQEQKEAVIAQNEVNQAVDTMEGQA